MTVLLYHDVVDGDVDSSGFAGPGAARYKLARQDFKTHLAHLAGLPFLRPVTLSQFPQLETPARADVLMLTFDDGGVSAATAIADELERHNWRAHFFATVNFIGTPGFLSVSQIRDLDQRGHVVGSHSCSHPTRMAACSRPQLDSEWGRSREILSDILGKPVRSASVPGGYYSLRVAQAAAAAGLLDLFTSEPTARVWQVDGCRVYGRYGVYRGTTAETVCALAAGSPRETIKQAAIWKLKKVLKSVGGEAYLGMREAILHRKY